MPDAFPTAVPPRDDATPARVLVVDDDPAVRTLVAVVLRRAGHEAVVAEGVNAALAELAGGEFEVALVDLDMPGRNGLELLAELRTRNHPIVPVLLTGTTSVGIAVEGMKLGAFDYLAKPANPDAIRWTVSRAVGVARSRKRERALERVVAEWRTTFDTCPDVILLMDSDDRIVQANRAACELSGLFANELIGRRAADVFFSGLNAAIADGRASGQVMRTFDPARSEHLTVTVTPISPTDPAPGIVVVVRDVTEAVRAEETRTRLLRQLHTAQEDERGRLSRDLHDGIGQQLVSLLVGLSVAADEAAPGESADRLRRLARLAGEASEETRRLARGLRPAALDDLGLKAALTRLTDDFTRLYGVRADVVAPAQADDRYPAEVESAVYRIAQEALANVAKHAVAKTVDVVLDGTGDTLHLSVSDDGIGFTPDPRPRSATGGLGLSDIRERAALLGGAMRVVSAPGRGTTVDVRFPVRGQS